MKKFSPLKADHWLVVDQHKCAGCGEVFKEGEATTLVAVGPGADQEERAPYPAHWACVTGEEDL